MKAKADQHKSISKIYNVPNKTILTNDKLEKAPIKSVKHKVLLLNTELFEGKNKRSGIGTLVRYVRTCLEDSQI